MGRIADALDRARREGTQRADVSDPPRRPSTGQKWSDWYGAAALDAGPPVIQTVAEPLGAPVDGLSEQIATYYARSSVVSEQYRSLRTRLQTLNPRQEHRMYAISSAIPREGKSVTTVNLAFSMAEIRHLKIIMVDADLRHSSMGRLLGGQSSPGLADVLAGEATLEQVIRATPVPNLYYLAAGRTHGRSATELLSAQTARSVFTRLKKEFHYSIVDTPAATSVADVGILGPWTSGVIMVIRMHRTPEPLARRAIKHLSNNNIPIMGCIVIGDNDPTSAYGRRYNYHCYYGSDGP